jgi:hypothetical protein
LLLKSLHLEASKVGSLWAGGLEMEVSLTMEVAPLWVSPTHGCDRMTVTELIPRWFCSVALKTVGLKAQHFWGKF